MEFPFQEIPDQDSIYYRVHFNDIDVSGQPKPGAFRNSPRESARAGMSVNWAKYSTAEEARQNARKPSGEYSVVRLLVGEVRAVPGQTVVHEPVDGNQSHSEVFGVKDTEARVRLLEIPEVVLGSDQASAS